MKLEGKNIVITGGTSGIGLEVVRQLSNTNNLIVVSRQKEKLNRLLDEFKTISPFQADLSIGHEVEEVADKITNQCSEIDILINNAAIQYTPSFLDDDFSFDSIKREISINLTSVCSLCYLLLPRLLKESRSLILNVNSGLGLSPKSSSSVYCATKGAMNIFSQSLSFQLESTNIRVLQSFMPLVDTPMTHGRGSGKITAVRAADKIIEQLMTEKANSYVGKVKFLKALLRISPSTAQKIMRRM